MPLGDLTTWDEALERGEEIYYNEDGRLRFQTLLSLAVTAVVDATRELSDGIHEGQICKQENPETWKYEDPIDDHATCQEWAAHLELLALRVHAWIRALHILTAELGAFVKQNLAFLRRVYGIQSITEPPQMTTPLAPSSSASASFYDDLELLGSVATAETQGASSQDDTDLTDENYLDAAQKFDNEWDRAAMAYLDLITLTYVAMPNLCHSSKPGLKEDYIAGLLMQKVSFEHVQT